MSDKAVRPADKSAAKAAAMEAMKSAAVKAAAAMKASAAVTTTAVTATMAATAAMATTAAADLDQSVGNKFCGPRHGAGTCERQRFRALRGRQHQHCRREHACRGGDQASHIAARILNEKCNGIRIAGHNKSLPENARVSARLDRSRRKAIRARLNAS
jgi:KaiC/GvpD/RAD55 family RecA-like ATPase